MRRQWGGGLLAVVLCIVLTLADTAPALAQWGNNFQRQQQQQMMMEQQRRQQQQMMEQQRRQQQMLEQQRRQQQMMQQQRQMQEQQRRQAEQQRRQAEQQRQRQHQMNATRDRQRLMERQSRDRQLIQQRAMVARQRQQVILSRALAERNRPPTVAEMQRGFTGRFTADGRAIVRAKGRIMAVNAATIGRQAPQRAGVVGSRSATPKRSATRTAANSNIGPANASGTQRGAGAAKPPSQAFFAMVMSPSMLVGRGRPATNNGQIIAVTQKSLRDQAMKNPAVAAGVNQLVARVKAQQHNVASDIRRGPISRGQRLHNKVARTFRGGSYTRVNTPKPMKLYRVYGGDAKEVGSYWTTQKPDGVLQAKIQLALKHQWGNTAQAATEITVPPGTIIYRGYAAKQENSTGGEFVGGGEQIYIPHVRKSWFDK